MGLQRDKPGGWATLRDKLIVQYIDAIDEASLNDLVNGRIPESEQTTHKKPILRLSRKLCRKLYKAVANCILPGTPADNLNKNQRA